MCYGVGGVNGLMHQHACNDVQLQEKCRPVLECMLNSVLSWNKILIEREEEEERLAAETPRTIENKLKLEEKSDKKRLKEIKKENKGVEDFTMEDAEDILELEKNPPQKSATEELNDRYTEACIEMFAPKAMLERETLKNIEEGKAAAAEIPTVRLRIDCAKALANADFIGLSDPFVVVYDSGALEHEEQNEGTEGMEGREATDNSNTKEQSIGITQVVDDSLEPVWEEAFDVKIGDMSNFLLRKFRFEVYDYDIIGDNEFLGACQLTGEEVMERVGKPNKYYFLTGMKGKSMKYVAGRLKLGFDLLGAGGFSSGNDVYSETLDIPEKGDTPIDFLAYGLYRSSIEFICIDQDSKKFKKNTNNNNSNNNSNNNVNNEAPGDAPGDLNWLPIRHVLGKLPITEKDAAPTLEEKETIRMNLERCDQLKGMKMTSMEQSLVMKCIAMNSLMEHLDWSSNPMLPTNVMTMNWCVEIFFQIENLFIVCTILVVIIVIVIFIGAFLF